MKERGFDDRMRAVQGLTSATEAEAEKKESAPCAAASPAEEAIDGGMGIAAAVKAAVEAEAAEGEHDAAKVQSGRAAAMEAKLVGGAGLPTRPSAFDAWRRAAEQKRHERRMRALTLVVLLAAGLAAGTAPAAVVSPISWFLAIRLIALIIFDPTPGEEGAPEDPAAAAAARVGDAAVELDEDDVVGGLADAVGQLADTRVLKAANSTAVAVGYVSSAASDLSVFLFGLALVALARQPASHSVL